MKFQADIRVMPLKELLDPQGKAVLESLGSIGIPQFEDIRIGKQISTTLEAENEEEARKIVEGACQKLLYNAVMEQYEYTIHTV